MRTGWHWWWAGAVAALVVAGGLVGPAGAQPPAPPAKESTLEEILRILRQGGQITEEQEKALREKAKQEERGRFLAGIDEQSLKPYLRSADDNFKVELGGRIQFDYQTGEGDERLLTGQEISGQFLVRRARLDVTGEFFRWVGFKIEADFAGTPSLTDGYVDLKFMRELELRGGQFKVPFSLEELTSSRFIDFVERSMVNELAPARDAGVALSGQFFDRVLGYSVGVFNGSGQNTADTNNEKSFAGRVTVAPFRNMDSFWLKGLQIGVNGTAGDQGNSTSARGRTTARTNPRFQFFAPQPTNGDRYRWGVDLAWLIGPGSLKFEYDSEIDQRKRLGPGGSDLDDVIATGFYVTGTFVLTGEPSVLNGPVVPRRPFVPFRGQIGPGAWELAVRYSELKFRSDDPVDFFDGNINNGITGGGRTAENGAQSVTVGVNWYLNSRTRMMFNWSNYWYETELGTPFSCNLSVCSAANLQRRGGQSWEIQTRLQFWF